MLSHDLTTQKAFRLLRPVLQKLDVRHLKKEPHIVRASDYPNLVDAGMGKWIITARQATFREGQEKKAFGFIARDEKKDRFLLSICVDERLFIDGDPNPVSRKEIKKLAVHELVHGFAFMVAATILDDGIFCDIVNLLMRSRIEISSLDSGEYTESLSIVGYSLNCAINDAHFRILGTGFKGDYSELYNDLLLSYQLAYEFMEKAKKQMENGGDFPKLLKHTIDALVNEKALDSEFVEKRMRLFLPWLYSRFCIKPQYKIAGHAAEGH